MSAHANAPYFIETIIEACVEYSLVPRSVHQLIVLVWHYVRFFLRIKNVLVLANYLHLHVAQYRNHKNFVKLLITCYNGRNGY